MDRLAQIVQTEVEKYAGSGRGANIRLFPVIDEKRQTYTVTAVDYPTHKAPAMIVVLARLVGETVVIEEDVTDKPLLDALLQQGIPRNQIVLAYQGEPIPDPIDLLI
jgi:hypothetical protein